MGMIRTPEEDFERMARNLMGTKGDMITDRETFETAYIDYFDAELNPQLMTSDFIGSVWSEFLKISSLDKMYKGKDLKRDKQRTAKTVVGSVDEYMKLDHTKVDLAGFDMPKEFKIPGKSKGKIVYARPHYTRMGSTMKLGLKFRDKKGRFVKVSKSYIKEKYGRGNTWK